MTGGDFGSYIDRDLIVLAGLAVVGVLLGGYELIRFILWVIRHVSIHIT